MPRFAANLTLLFDDSAFIDRFAAAAAAGFTAVECQFPYEEQPQVLRDRLDRHGLILVLHNLPAGDWAGGERGIACYPDRVDDFRRGVELGVRYAAALGCRRLNCLAGLQPPGTEPARVVETLVDNVRFAAKRLAEAGIELVLEALNTHDVPGFLLHRTEQVVDIIEMAGCPNVSVQFDAYHMQTMGEDLTATLTRFRTRISHVQIADAPGRHEPGTGIIDFAALFAWLDENGYSGYVGCEYRPLGSTSAGLRWMAPYRALTGM